MHAQDTQYLTDNIHDFDSMAYPHYRSQFGDTTFTKVFVGGLAWETHTEEMRKYFEQFGEILEAVIITDKNTGKSKGYGFVTFRDPESARRACVEANPVIDGRRANCNIASLGRPRPTPPRGRNQGGTSSYNQGGTSVPQGAPPYGGMAPPIPPPLPPPPPPVVYPPYGHCITHKYNSHNITSNCMEHLLLPWALPITMVILFKPQLGVHILLHHSHKGNNAYPDHHIYTILCKWRDPSPPILLHLFKPQGNPLPLLQIHRRLSKLPPQKQRLQLLLQIVQIPKRRIYQYIHGLDISFNCITLTNLCQSTPFHF